MYVGEEWIYRLRDYSESERVRVLAVEKRKTSTRVDIEFLDGDKAGSHENVPGARLRAPWSTVQHYDRSMADWQRLECDDYEIDEVENYAIVLVFDQLIPDEVACQEWRPVRDAVAVHDREALEALLGVELRAITETVEWFEADGTTMLSPAAGPIIAELVCRRNPIPILDRIIEQEAEIREHCKRGRNFKSLITGKDEESSPEHEYHVYLKHDRPRHELLRQWCGYRSVTFQERLRAAEAETRRLDILVAELIDSLRESQPLLAEEKESEHEQERITPQNIRPTIDRPLEPWEMPVVYIKTKQKRWW